MERPHPLDRSAFKAFLPVPTRWADNDVYGHVNNVSYFSYFDTAVNQWLIHNGLLDFHSQDDTAPVGLVVANQCQYFAPLAFPQSLEVGIRISQLGASSVRYDMGVFASDAAQTAALGQFTHVYVNRSTRRPMPLPPAWRDVFQTLLIKP